MLRWFFPLLFVLSRVAVAQTASPTPASPQETRIAVWKPIFETEGELFPSAVLSMSGRKLNAPPNAHVFGDPLGLARVAIRPTVANANVHVEVQIEGFSELSAEDAVLPEPGQVYSIAPVVRYKFTNLAALDQSVPATVTYAVKLNGLDLGHQTVPIRVRSVNDVPFLMIGQDGKQQDFSPLFAAYVNESHPFVDNVLQEALRWHAVNEFVGYQRGADAVHLQVFAIWNVLQRHHLHYSSITTPSAASTSGKIYSQAVRFIDQSISSQQANCVDGSVLFASVLYKIGIQPVLVMKPGHMFVGYYLDQGHKQIEFLETTMLGAGNQPGIHNIAFSPVLHPAQASESYRQFENAVAYADNAFSKEVQPAIQRHQSGFTIIDIAAARRAGINTIPRLAH